MRKTVFTLFILLTCMATRADIGEFSFGAQTAYGTRDKVMGIGLNAKYNFSYHTRINLLADYFFKKNDVWGSEFALEWNYHVHLGDNLRLYPLLGIGMRNYHSHYDTLIGKESDVEGYFIGNGGVGIDYLIGDHLMLNSEIKYQRFFSENVGQVLFMIGVSYRL